MKRCPLIKRSSVESEWGELYKTLAVPVIHFHCLYKIFAAAIGGLFISVYI